jgi:arylsulfatase A-like enzyme
MAATTRRSAALFAGLLAACGAAPEPPGPAPPRGVLLVVIDTLRADRVGALGAENDTSPALDRLAARSVVFENAVAESCWTIPSHFSLFTGLYPSRHGVVEPQAMPAPDLPLLATRLSDAGFFTFAETDGGWMSSERGFDRGFLEFRGEARGVDRTLAAFERELEALAGKDRRFFGFLHTYEVHCPYTPPPPYAGMFRDPGSEPVQTEGRCGNPHFNAMELGPGQRRFLAEQYDGGVRYADEVLARLWERLERDGFLDDTIVVVTSDHGEELFEHGRIGHEGTLHREALAIPLLLFVPGHAPRRIAHPVGLVDLLPTLLDLLAVDDDAPRDGRSLVPLLAGAEEAPSEDFRFSELHWGRSLDSWMSADEHLIVDRDSGERWLYDLRDDPAEARDLGAQRPERADELARALAAFRAGLGPPRLPAGSASPLSERARDELRKLGYGGD